MYIKFGKKSLTHASSVKAKKTSLTGLYLCDYILILFDFFQTKMSI